MKNFLLTSAALLLFSCASTPATQENTDASYGYTEKNPVKVGGVESGPANERNYLNSLSGPNGEAVWFERTGSCCPFSTKNGFMGGGMLDRYAVTYEGKKDTVFLYINMYDSAKLKAPVGFRFK